MAQVPGKSTPLIIGQGREVPETAHPTDMNRLLSWHPTPSGGWVAAVQFDAEGAQGIRLGLRATRLPDGSRVRVHEPGGTVAIERSRTDIIRQTNAATPGQGVHWLPSVSGPSAVLEIELPAGARITDVELSVPLLSHLTEHPAQLALVLKHGWQPAASCNLDAACSPEVLEQSRSVAHMHFVLPTGSAALCTGTLLADVQATGRAFFLTANHCLDTPEVAATVETYWFYRSPQCGGAVAPVPTVLSGGADLVASHPATDMVLLQLRDNPPQGALFAGSLLAPVGVGTELVGLHHPNGDVLKVSQGVAQGYATCTSSVPGVFGCFPDSELVGNFLSVQWRSGVTEGGSSGSAIFARLGERRYVVGQLRGGGSYCHAPTVPDFYGRFDLGYASTLRTILGEPPASGPVSGRVAPPAPAPAPAPGANSSPL